MAPEVIACETSTDEPYTSSADIWSLGITLIELAQMEPPYNNMNPSRVLMKIRKADPPGLDAPHKWSAEFKEVVRLCLTKDPTQRPSATQLLQLVKFVSSESAADCQPLVELVLEARAEVTVLVTDVDSLDLINSMNSDTHSAGDSSAEPGSPEIMIENSPELVRNGPVEPVKETDAESSLPVIIPDAVPSTVTPDRETANGDVHRESVPTGDKALADDERVVENGQLGTDVKRQGPPTLKRRERETQVWSLHIDDDVEDGEILRERIKAESANSTASQTSETQVSGAEVFAANRPFAWHRGLTNKRHNAAEESPFGRQKVRYQSLTKTRRYVYQGQVHTRRTSRVIVSGAEVLERREHETRKVERQALQLLQRAEKRQRDELEQQAAARRNALGQRLDQRRQDLVKSYADDLERIEREYKQKRKKSDTAFSRYYNETSSQLKTQQDRELQFLQENHRQGLKDCRQRGSREDVERLELEYMEKERKYSEQQRSVRELNQRQLVAQRHEQTIASELRLLEKKHQLLRCREAALWEVEERHLLELGAEKKQNIQQSYDLRRRQLAFRRTQEMDIAVQANSRQLSELLRRHAADCKQQSKQQKKEWRTRRQAFCDQADMRRAGIISEQDRTRLRQFDDAEKQRMKEKMAEEEQERTKEVESLRRRHAEVIDELDHVFLTRQRQLLEHETSALKDEEKKFNVELRKFREGLIVRKEQLEKELRRQRMEMDPDMTSSMTVSSRHSRHSQQFSPGSSQYDLDLLFGDQTSTVF